MLFSMGQKYPEYSFPVLIFLVNAAEKGNEYAREMLGRVYSPDPGEDAGRYMITSPVVYDQFLRRMVSHVGSTKRDKVDKDIFLAFGIYGSNEENMYTSLAANALETLAEQGSAEAAYYFVMNSSKFPDYSPRVGGSQRSARWSRR